MDENGERPLDDQKLTYIIGLLSLLAGLLSAILYQTRGDWPAQLNGWGFVLFACLGIGLIGLGWWGS